MSFHKASDFRISIAGTKLKNNLPFTSSGIPSLDHVIGGGLPSGGVFVVEEDVLGNYSRVLSKYFLAEGVACKHALFIASADEDPHNIVNELPQPCTASLEEEVASAGGGVDKMKIAWRYEGLNQVESSFGGSNFGHNFDLSKHIDPVTINNINATYCDLRTCSNNAEADRVSETNSVGCYRYDMSDPDMDMVVRIFTFKNPLYYKLLTSIKDAVSKYEYSCISSNILRISIQSLGSPVWMALDCEEGDHSYGQDLLKFMYCLRVIIRDLHAIAFVTIPSHLFDNDNIMKRLLNSVDNAVRIESFAGSDREANPVYKDYHGLFHVTKLAAVHSIVPFVPPSLDLAFKLKRKKFLIEKLHLPPELQDSSEREQDDITATPTVTCGGFKKKDIDF